jgi:hypothetical protein
MTARKTQLRIGNASGYWGDDPLALHRQVHGGRLDYITMDFLAEVTMSIMQKQRSRDPELGYARDFVAMLEGVLPKLLQDKTRIITNAGGVNPEACAAAIAALARKLGLTPKIAVVIGDDILGRLDELRGAEKSPCAFDNMETGQKYAEIAGRVEAANIYFGAAPVVEALKWEPDIIITGRVTDTGITIAPMIHEFGWSWRDWDKLASGIVAGHILECGSQATGGNFTDWQRVESFKDIGYPIAQVQASGEFVITKHPGTGGLVSCDTVREQLFYEMGHPKAYITPDVVADFSTIRLQAAGKDRVKITGVKGYEPTPLYKVSMAYTDGGKAVGEIAISGPHARAKAEAFAKIFWTRCGRDFVETATEYFGWNACHRTLTGQAEGNEIILRLGVRDQDKNKLKAFGKLIPSLILGGPPGVCVLGGVPKIQDVVSYWPALMPKTAVTPRIALFRDGFTEVREVDNTQVGRFEATTADAQIAPPPPLWVAAALAAGAGAGSVPLSTLALGRSGDKGDTANIGIMARSQAAFEFLGEQLTAQRVKDLFQELCHGRVVRHTLPNMQGYNFLLENSLGGGGTMTLRTDAQGKTFAQALLRTTLNAPAALVAELRGSGR